MTGVDPASFLSAYLPSHTALYPCLIGAAWSDLDDPVQWFHMAAREWAVPGERGAHVSVTVILPLVGLLIHYQGYIERADWPPMRCLIE